MCGVTRVFAIPDLQETRSTCQEWAGGVGLSPGHVSVCVSQLMPRATGHWASAVAGGFKVRFLVVLLFWGEGNVKGWQDVHPTRFSNVGYHTKWVLTKISPFENAKLGLWINQRRAGGGKET